MIDVDDRVGSRELYGLFKLFKAPVQLKRLNSADFAFRGNGPSGEVRVGVERKEIGDFCQSFTSGRFTGEQLPKLHKDYDYVFLIVEGMTRRGKDEGELLVFRNGGWVCASGLTWASYQGILTTLTLRANVICRETINNGETAGIVAGLWRWFRRKWRDHESHLGPAKVLKQDSWMVHAPSPAERFAYQLPGIGPRMSRVVARFFPTPEEMVAASVEDWQMIPGVGEVTAQRVVEALHKRKRRAK